MQLTDITRLGEDGKPVRVVKETYHGLPVLVEERPIRLAKFPVNGEALYQSILLHPRYADPKSDHEIIQVRGFRRGRTIDIILDEPSVIGDISYPILSFKGVGADADRPLVIHPTKWYEEGNWIARYKTTNGANRFWGGIKRGPAVAEHKDPILPDYGIPFTPHLAINHLSKELSRYISEVEGRRFVPTLTQIVRLFSTNIRLDHVKYLDQEERKKFIDPEKLATIDAKIFGAEIQVYAYKKKIIIENGYVVQNRLIDGTFTDSENYVLKPSENEWSNRWHFILDTMASSMNSLMPDIESVSNYMSALDTKTQGILCPHSPTYKDLLKAWIKDADLKHLIRRARKNYHHKNCVYKD